MQVFINGRFLTQCRTGVQRFAFETLLALDELLSHSNARSKLDMVVLAPRGTSPPQLAAIRFRTVAPFSGHLWEQVTLPMACGRGLLLGFSATGPLFKRHQAVTLHDAAVFAVPHTFGLMFRLWYRLVLPILARRARYLLTVSEFSKAELTRFLGRRLKSARVSGEGWQHVLRAPADQSVLRSQHLTKGRYILVVGSITPHKNLAVVAKAAALLRGEQDIEVVVAGPINPTIFGNGDESATKQLKLIGYVNDSELRALYENAGAFVFPSKYEGFGIPPIEAMALGCPVVASNAAAIPEVCGHAAWYFAPDDAAELARLLRRLLTQPDARAELVALGYGQATRHSWDATALHFWELIEESLQEHVNKTLAESTGNFDVGPSPAALAAGTGTQTSARLDPNDGGISAQPE